MKICEVLKEEEVNMTIDSMFRMLCLGLIGREKFMGAALFAKSCGLLTPVEFSFLSEASLRIVI